MELTIRVSCRNICKFRLLDFLDSAEPEKWIEIMQALPLKFVLKDTPLTVVAIERLNILGVRHQWFPELNIELVPLKHETLSDDQTCGSDEEPFIHIFVAEFDAIDVYRQTIRPRLSRWLQSLANDPQQGFIVLFSEPNNGLRKVETAFLLDKLRFDFGDKPNCLILPANFSSSGELGPLKGAISGLLVELLPLRLQNLDSECKAIDSLRFADGWSFYNFFQAKERLALAWLRCGFVSAAIICYNELEAVFYDALDRHSVAKPELTNIGSWLPSQAVFGDDIIRANFSRKRCETWVVASLSAYDVGVYLTSCKLELLLKSGNLSQLLLEIKRFICTFIALDYLDKNSRLVWEFDAYNSFAGHIYPIIPDPLSKSDACALCDCYMQIVTKISDIKRLCPLTDRNDSNVNSVMKPFRLLREMETSEYPLFQSEVLKLALDTCIKSGQNYMAFDAGIRYADHLMLMGNLAEAVAVMDVFYKRHDNVWPRVRLELLRRLSNCHKSMAQFERYVKLELEKVMLINDFSCDRLDYMDIWKYQLANSVNMPFESFFHIESIHAIIADTSLSVLLQLTPFLPFGFQESGQQDHALSHGAVPFVECTFWHDQDEIQFMGTGMMTDTEVFSVNLMSTGICKRGIYKLKQIRLQRGSVSFTNETSMIDHSFSVDVPNPVSFSISFIEPIDPTNASLQFGGRVEARRIENVQVQVSCSSLSLYQGKNGDKIVINSLGSLSNGDLFDFKLQLADYLPGEHRIRVSLTFDSSTAQPESWTEWICVNVPEIPVSASSINLLPFERSIDTVSLSQASGSLVAPIKSIGEDTNQVSGLCPIEPYKDSSISVSNYCREFSKPIQIAPIFGPAYLIYPNSPRVCNFCEMILHHSAGEKFFVGHPIEFSLNTNIPFDSQALQYALEADHNDWTIFGHKSGELSENTTFNIIPLRSGVISLPVVRLSGAGVDCHYITEGQDIVVHIPDEV